MSASAAPRQAHRATAGLIITGLATLVHLSFLLSVALHFQIVSLWPPKIIPEVTVRALNENLAPVKAAPSSTGAELHSLYETRRVRGIHLWDRLFWDSTRYEVAFDFFGLYKGALNLLRGESIYEVARYDQPYTIFTDPIVPYYAPYIYPPLVSYFLVPMALVLSPWSAFLAWLVLQELLLVWCIRISRLLFDSHLQRSVVTAMWLCFTPFYLLLYIGQTSFVIATCILLLAHWHLSERKLAADWAWIVSVAIKLLTLIAAPILVRSKRYWAIILAGAIVIVASLPYFVARPDDLLFFVYLVKSRTVAPNGGDFSHSEVFWLLLGPNAGQLASRLFMWAAILASVALTFIPRRISFLDGLSLWICTYFLAYIRVWEHHYVMILPVLVLLWYSTKSRVVLVVYLLLALPTPLLFFDGSWSYAQKLIYHLCKLVPVAVLYGYIAKTILARRFAARAAAS